MPLIRQPVSNLLGGVSQQPPATRNPNQCQTQINAWPSPVYGITKRQPTKLIKKLTATAPTSARYHIIDRGPSERYLIIFRYNAAPLAYTLLPTATKAAGDALTVTDSGGVGYAYTTNTVSKTAFETLRVHTVADYTFLVNNTKTVALDSATTSARPYNTEAYIFVRQGNYKSNYKVTYKIGATTYTVTVKTWDGNPSSVANSSADPTDLAHAELDSIKTDDIAEEIKGKLMNATYGGQFGVGEVDRLGSVVRIRSTQTITNIETLDSVGDTTLSVVWKKIPRVAGYLPEICTHGFKVKIEGDAQIAQDDYFVSFVADGGSGTFGKGYWQEDLDYSEKYKFDASTMPHAMVRRWDGSNDPYFTWERPAWTDKLTGNSTLPPSPSFVGKSIQNIVFYKERLGFLADDRVILSETHEPLNFWRTTLLVLEDSAPIDLTINHSPVALCKSGIAFNENLILKSGRNQFILRGGDILSPRTVSITPISSYENYEELEPIPGGRSLFFGFKRGDFSGVREFFQLGDADAYDSADVTAQVPNYIPGTIEWMALSTLEETLLVKGSTYADRLYVYKYMWNGQEKAISSWGYWEFGYGCTVRFAAIIDNTVYLVNEYSDGIHAEKIDIATGLLDSGANFVTHLDRRIDNTQVTSETYNAGPNTTTIVLPYVVPSDFGGISHTMAVVRKITGTVLSATYVSSTATNSTITVTGDVTGWDYWVGHSYPETYGLTKPIVKLPAGRGLVPETGCVQRVKHLEFEYSGAGWAVVYVTVGNRTPVTYYIGLTPNANGAIIYTTDLIKTDKARIPIHGRADELTVEITNPYPYPFNITSAIWEIMMYESGRRIV